MNKRLMMTLTALMLMSVTIWAVPAKPGVKKIVTLADGSVVELTLKVTNISRTIRMQKVSLVWLLTVGSS